MKNCIKSDSPFNEGLIKDQRRFFDKVFSKKCPTPEEFCFEPSSKSLSEIIREAIEAPPPEPPTMWKQLRELKPVVNTMKALDLLSDEEYQKFQNDLEVAEKARWE